jgi:thiamine kinase-like enzyme
VLVLKKHKLSDALGSPTMRVEEIVERVWPGRPATVEVLGGGITNHNFKVALDDGTYVLRIAGRDTNLLGIDRRAEYEASLAAAAVGVGPEVIELVEPEGYLVTRFIEGTRVPAETMGSPDGLGRFAQSLRAVHAVQSIPSRFDAFRVVEVYRERAVAHGIPTPAAYEHASQIADEIQRVRGPVAERACHNDLLNANLVDDGRRIRIVDWEYAGMGDVFFDLANFSVNHAFDRDARKALLEAYFGEVGVSNERWLELMLFMSDFREAMWGVIQGAMSELEFDFVAYADEHFDRMEVTAASPAFVNALESA